MKTIIKNYKNNKVKEVNKIIKECKLTSIKLNRKHNEINLSKIINILEKHKDELINNFNIKHLYLFGSYVIGGSNEYSDIDIYVIAKKKINPYKVTDAGGAFPSGDAFSVYPYRNGVIPSIRLKVFKEALDDVSLLYMLENKIGREETIKLLDKTADTDITFKNYPRNEEFFDKLNDLVFDNLK